MNETAELHNEINQALDTLECAIQKIDKKDYSQRPKAIRRCENQASQISSTIESCNVEMYNLEKTETAYYKKALQQCQERLNMLLEELEFKKRERETEGTLIGEMMKRSEALDEVSDGSTVIQIGRVVQNKGTVSLMRTWKKVIDADRIADEVSIELQRQLEKIENTTKTVTDTRSDIKTAGKYIRYFVKEMYSDKIITCLMILCLIACLVIFILKLTKGGSEADTEDSLPNNGNQVSGIYQ